jgi:hypothetical protein
MKISTLDLTKTLSDFLFLWVKNPEEKAKEIFIFKHTLTAHGFEKYIQYYFSKVLNYSVKLNWSTFQFDQWIDLKGVKYENGINNFIVIQCKKFSTKDITEDHVSTFYWKIIDIVSNEREKFEIYYITTSKFTQKAKEFWEEKWIHLVDFSQLYEFQIKYSISQFKSDILNEEWSIEHEKCFDSSEELAKLYDSFHNVIQPTQQELFYLLKQIRRDYSWISQLRLWDIAKNETLNLLALERPHNLEALKTFSSQLTTRERNKILKHWEIFIERLKYLHNPMSLNRYNWPEIKVSFHKEENKKQENIIQKLLKFF